jgi:hypothetical protein
VHQVNAVVEANKAKNLTSDMTDLEEHWVGGELLRDDGTISIMEWTGERHVACVSCVFNVSIQALEYSPIQ